MYIYSALAKINDAAPKTLKQSLKHRHGNLSNKIKRFKITSGQRKTNF